MREGRAEKAVTLIAQLIDVRLRCLATNNAEWAIRHTDRLTQLAMDVLPTGSGFDHATTIDLDQSTPDKIVLHTSFHHMDEGGSYDGWTDHTITVRPSLAFSFRLTISGRDRNSIKEYISETFEYALSQDVQERYNEETEQSTFWPIVNLGYVDTQSEA